MKIGDIIQRKDMPQIWVRIIGENDKWDAWIVELVTQKRGMGKMKEGMVMKNDDRWEIVKG